MREQHERTIFTDYINNFTDLTQFTNMFGILTNPISPLITFFLRKNIKSQLRVLDYILIRKQVFFMNLSIYASIVFDLLVMAYTFYFFWNKREDGYGFLSQILGFFVVVYLTLNLYFRINLVLYYNRKIRELFIDASIN